MLRFNAKSCTTTTTSLLRCGSRRTFACSSIIAKNQQEDVVGTSADIEAIETASDGKVKITIKPLPRDNETEDAKRRRLVYQSRKRGILETDLLLSRFAKKYINQLSLNELKEYDELLDNTDWDIFYWATKNYDITPLPKRWENSEILKKLQELSENKEREVLRMPNLHH